ncbi:MAG TPA: hypothetical protein HPP77_07050 [Candidatus Hydrogenedentes bacterium]|nr:hypothetical protein [Candidatus Hydrogenedentota bacterium]HIJ73212.1 hypothetical protein [Candidatus Hydrogenedentota bacterium]
MRKLMGALLLAGTMLMPLGGCGSKEAEIKPTPAQREQTAQNADQQTKKLIEKNEGMLKTLDQARK